MKSFLLAALVAAGLACSASSADAQFRARRGAVYYGSTYSYPTYSSPYSYAVPNYYSGGVVTSSYTPYGTSTGAITTSGYTPAYSGSYYDPYLWNTYPTYGYSSYYNGGMYRGRGWRW
jgi:hypothetical protein